MKCASVVLLVVLALAGCDHGATPPGADPSPVTGLRIVSLAPHLTELTFSAGAGDQLVGVVAHSDYPQQALAVPIVGDAFRIDPEQLAVLRPDLILAWKGGNPDALIEQLISRGYRVAVFKSDSLDDVATALLEIGRLAGTLAVARPRAAEYLDGLANHRAQRRGAVVEVFYQITAQPLYTVGRSHTINDMITLCGGHNIFADMADVAPAVSVEEVLLRAPAVIIAGRVPGADGLDQWRRWKTLPAVKNGHLYEVNASQVTRASTRMLDGIAEICDKIQLARYSQDTDDLSDTTDTTSAARVLLGRIHAAPARVR